MNHRWCLPSFATSSVLAIAAVAFAIGIFIVDTITPLEGAVAVLYEVFSLKQAGGWNGQVAIHPEVLPAWLKRWGEIVAAGKRAETEARLRLVDGEFRWFLFLCEPLCDDHGNVIRWYGTNTDIEVI